MRRGQEEQQGNAREKKCLHMSRWVSDRLWCSYEPLIFFAVVGVDVDIVNS